MVSEHKGYFLLSTVSSSLLLRVNEVGKLVSEYYGPRLLDEREFPALTRIYSCSEGTSVAYKEEEPAIVLDTLYGEVSTGAKGDYLYPSLIISREDLVNFDFVYDSFLIRKPEDVPGLPTPHGAKEELVIRLVDKEAAVALRLHYLVYEESDVIGRYFEIINEGEKPLAIEKAASFQFMTRNRDYTLATLYGSWVNEGNLDEAPLRQGRFLFGSDTGSSSNRHNPFFSLVEKGATPSLGHGYAFNLVYSGSHEESVELSTFGDVRVMGGLSSLHFCKILAKGSSFATPMAVMTTSEGGANGLSANFQRFVNSCVVPERFAYRERPIVYNNWEATYFKFTKGKLLSLMDEAKKLGMEYFVLDDGWFGARSDDFHGLGDWVCNTKKIPGGLASLAGEAKKRGLGFGIWMEPEMVNEDSDLYRAHPDWIIHDGVHAPVKGRHQYVLDLTKKEVEDFVVSSVESVIRSADISFLKWDYNRPIADIPGGRGSFMHDYMLGLYRALRRITSDLPDLLIEMCASGGNRFDLGMLFYAPQIWASDDTDCHQRVVIQTGLARAYPPSTISCHVSAKTSMQLLRKTSLDSKFDVACFGVLGYELDLSELTPLDEKVIKRQTEFYKKYRKTLQFGRFRVLSTFADSPVTEWQTSLGKTSLVGRYNAVASPAPGAGYLRVEGLDDKKMYLCQVREETIDLKTFGSLINFVSPIHLQSDGFVINALSKHRGMESEKDRGLVSGAALRGRGFALSPEWSALGYNEHVRFVGDFGGRVYLIEEAES